MQDFRLPDVLGLRGIEFVFAAVRREGARRVKHEDGVVLERLLLVGITERLRHVHIVGLGDGVVGPEAGKGHGEAHPDGAFRHLQRVRDEGFLSLPAACRQEADGQKGRNRRRNMKYLFQISPKIPYSSTPRASH